MTEVILFLLNIVLFTIMIYAIAKAANNKEIGFFRSMNINAHYDGPFILLLTALGKKNKKSPTIGKN